MMAKKTSKGGVTASRGVQAMDVGLRILEVLAAHDRALALREISEAVDMAPSNVHRYLASFVQAGLLRQDPDTARYDLGRLALQVGLAALSRDQVLREAPTALRQIVEQFKVMGIILSFGAQGPTIVRFLQTSPPLVISLRLGSIVPLLRSASGRVFASFLPEQLTGPLVERELRTHDAGYELAHSTPRSMTELRQLIKRVRRDFCAIVEVDVSPGLVAAASPVLNERGEALATLSLMGSKTDLAPEGPAISSLITTCKHLSRSAGYQGPWAA